MEMNSFASDRVGPRGETPAPKKIARKSTTPVPKDDKKPKRRIDPNEFEVYEVVGTLRSHYKAAMGLNDHDHERDRNNRDPDNDPDHKNKEALVNPKKTKDPLYTSKKHKFLNYAYMIEAEQAEKKPYMEILDMKLPQKIPYATIPMNKMIIGEAPRPSVESTNAGIKADKKSDVPGMKDCGYMIFHGKEETLTDSCPSSKMAGSNDKETKKEKSEDGVSSIGEMPEGGAAEGKIGGLSDTKMKIESSAPDEKPDKKPDNKGQKDEKDVLDKKVPIKVESKVPIKVESKVPIKLESNFPGEGPRRDPGEGPRRDPGEGPGKGQGEGPRKDPREAPRKVVTEARSKVPGEAPRKVPTEARSKVPGEGPRKFPTEGKSKFPEEGPRKFPTEGKSKFPGEGHKKFPTEGKTKFPGEGHKKFPTEGKSKVQAEAPRKVPTEVNGKVPGEGPKKFLTEVKSKVQAEAPRKVPTEVKSKVPEEAPRKVPTEARSKVPGEDPRNVPTEAKSKVPEKIPGDIIVQGGDINVSNDFEEVVVSSGFAWGSDDQSKMEYCDTTGNIDDDGNEDEDLIGQMKINETGSLEFLKKMKGNAVAENGTAVEIRDGKLVEKTGEGDKGAIQHEQFRNPGLLEIGLGEVITEEENKRKRIRKGEETKNLNLKKRKVEKSQKDDSNDIANGKDKGKSHGDKGPKKDSAKSGSTIYNQSTLEETIDRVASGHLSLPFLENLRGEIKSLSRADLEELIVQKLCEVITERSNVGDLRKRAEALEKNQERWKEKVLSLTKQIKEMDMVMKNYMCEVRRHHADKSYQMIAPLRVTRSVGLQVSITATVTQPSNPDKTMPKSSGDANHGREKGGKNSNRSVKVTEAPKKKIPILPTTSTTKPLVIDSQNKFSTKSGLTITLQPANSSSETQLASKPIPIQQPKLSILPATDLPTSGLIDLTLEEDRRLGGSSSGTTQQTLTVGPPGQVKVVNHIQPAQSPVGAVTFLISNVTSPSCCSSTTVTNTEGQNRQLAISGSQTQSTQRHILPAISTLIYKPNTLIQPGSQVMTSRARSPVTKSTKHPAPLPPLPPNQMQKSTWKQLPPKPSLKVTKGDTGIVLSWNAPIAPEYETIVSYQLFAYQESDSPPSSSLWKRVGEIKALRPPMACTLSQFLPGYIYHFSVRAVDIHSRVGPFSAPGTISLIP